MILWLKYEYQNNALSKISDSVIYFLLINPEHNVKSQKPLRWSLSEKIRFKIISTQSHSLKRG